MSENYDYKKLKKQTVEDEETRKFIVPPEGTNLMWFQGIERKVPSEGAAWYEITWTYDHPSHKERAQTFRQRLYLGEEKAFGAESESEKTRTQVTMEELVRINMRIARWQGWTEEEEENAFKDRKKYWRKGTPMKLEIKHSKGKQGGVFANVRGYAVPAPEEIEIQREPAMAGMDELPDIA